MKQIRENRVFSLSSYYLPNTWSLWTFCFWSEDQNPIANCLSYKYMVVPVVCVLVIVSKRGKTKVNVRENCYNEQLVEVTVFSSEQLTPLHMKFIHLIYFRGVFFCHHKSSEILVEWVMKPKSVGKQIRTTNGRMTELEETLCMYVQRIQKHAHKLLYVIQRPVRDKWGMNRATPVECTRKRQFNFFSWTKSIHAMHQQYKEVTAT